MRLRAKVLSVVGGIAKISVRLPLDDFEANSSCCGCAKDGDCGSCQGALTSFKTEEEVFSLVALPSLKMGESVWVEYGMPNRMLMALFLFLPFSVFGAVGAIVGDLFFANNLSIVVGALIGASVGFLLTWAVNRYCPELYAPRMKIIDDRSLRHDSAEWLYCAEVDRDL